MNVSLRQLRVFLAVARLGSFSRAADAVGLTQPAVSRNIGDLETELGLRLLDRTTREVALTHEGASLVGELTRLLDELETTLRAVRNVSEQRSGRVRVASSPTLSANLMPFCVAEALSAYPQIELMVLDQVQKLSLASIRNGDVDFGVVVDPEDDDLHTEPILQDAFCLVCRDDHPLAAQQQIRWLQLDKQKLVLLDYASGSRPLIDAALARHGVVGNVVQELGHPTTVFQMLHTGMGISVMPMLALPLPANSNLVWRPLVPRVNRFIMLARRRQRSLSPAAEVMWQLVRDVAARRKAS